MLLEKIQEIAVMQGQTATDVKLLREDWGASKQTFATCDEMDRIESKLDNHVQEHKEKNQFSITTFVALIASGASLIGVFIAWENLRAFMQSIPKGKP